MSTIIYRVENDTYPDGSFTVSRPDGTPVNLTGGTVKLVIMDTSTGLVTNAGH